MNEINKTWPLLNRSKLSPNKQTLVSKINPKLQKKHIFRPLKSLSENPKNNKSSHIQANSTKKSYMKRGKNAKRRVKVNKKSK